MGATRVLTASYASPEEALGAALSAEAQAGGAGFALRVLSGQQAGSVHPLRGERLALGSGRKNDLVFREPGVQFRHAAIHLRSAGVEIEGLSRLYLSVNGEALAKETRALALGAKITLGEVELELCEGEPSLAGGGGRAVLVWEPTPELEAALEGRERVALEEGEGETQLSVIDAGAIGPLGALWGSACGVVLWSSAPLEAVAAHLRAFKTLRHVDRSPWALRLAEASTLAKLLAVLNEHEAATLFGAVRTPRGERCPCCESALSGEGCECGQHFAEGAVIEAFVLAGEEQQRVSLGAGATRLVRKGRRGLQLRVEHLEALGVEDPRPKSLPAAEPAPLEEQREYCVELKSGETLRGSMARRNWNALNLRLAGGEERTILPEELADMASCSGPLREWIPERPVLRGLLGPEQVGAALSGGVESQRVYALLDAGSMPEQALDALEGELRLLRGRLTPEEVDTAGYLVELEAGDPQSEVVLRGVLEEGWGSVLYTASSPERLIDHVRNLLAARSTGGALTFRFYAPAVLSRYLTTATAADGAALFGSLRTAEGLSCPVCATGLEPEATACSWCEARFTRGQLISSWLVATPAGPAAFSLASVSGEAPARSTPAKASLRLRPEQLDVLGDDHLYRSGRPGVTESICAFVSRLFKDQWRALGDEAGQDLVRAGVERARAYGLWRREEISRFVNTMFFADYEFDRQASAWHCREVLHDRERPSRARIEEVWTLAVGRAQTLELRCMPREDS
jgi:type III secretion system (T3SS) inner membrane Yop/YscD-like protein/uncharacterized protein DUF4123